MASNKKEETGHICPVCWYPDLDEPAEPYNICPCCGTMFCENGFDFNNIPYTVLREKWLAEGCRWWYSPKILKDGNLIGMSDPRGHQNRNKPWPWPPEKT